MIAENMMSIRERKRLSLDEVARRMTTPKLKITRMRWWRWEMGLIRIPADLMPRIARALGTTITRLYRGAA